MITEIKLKDLNTGRFIEEKVEEINGDVGTGIAINALSGGVDSTVVPMLGHKALAKKLRTVFIQNWLMREGEPELVKGVFRKLGIEIESIDARTATLTKLPFEVLENLANNIIREVPGVVSVTYNITAKPPSTIEAV